MARRTWARAGAAAAVVGPGAAVAPGSWAGIVGVWEMGSFVEGDGGMLGVSALGGGRWLWQAPRAPWADALVLQVALCQGQASHLTARTWAGGQELLASPGLFPAWGEGGKVGGALGRGSLGENQVSIGVEGT